MSQVFDTCKQCATSFDVSDNRAHSPVMRELLFGSPKSVEGRLTDSMMVRCPACGMTYASKAVRYFGFITPGQHRAGLLVFVTAFAAVAIYLAATGH